MFIVWLRSDNYVGVSKGSVNCGRMTFEILGEFSDDDWLSAKRLTETKRKEIPQPTFD